ncbi:MAG: hypothetical protein M1592_06755 [Candidatus Thermoplasmatota archaeon]|nr:hypothetical protein [Candidatus Thermoplasmatota archaeon]MCL5882258.1 hypothetical protein [Candidatus Thermoplasmatota archaeon]
MTKMGAVLSIIASAAVSYATLFFLPLAYLAVIAAIPLMYLKGWRSFVAGLIVGIGSAFSLYLIYPFQKVAELSAIIGGIVSLSPVLVLVVFPLVYGLILGFASLLWSEIRENVVQRKAKSGTGSGN